MRKSTTYKKLIEIADFLEHFEERKPGKLKFNYRYFGKHTEKDHPPEGLNYCGTTACALGAAAIAGVAGLKARWQKASSGFYFLVPPTHRKDVDSDSADWFPYAEEKLGINELEFKAMFAAMSIPGDPNTVIENGWQAEPKDVAKVVRYIADTRYGKNTLESSKG